MAAQTRVTARLRSAPTFPIVLVTMAGLITYYALVTHLAFRALARRVLAVHFVTLADGLHESLAIWLHNSRLVVGVAICALLQILLRPVSTNVTRWIADGVLATWAVVTVGATGVLLGAYGAVQARVFWPFAPVELVAWGLLLSLYVDVRRGRARAGRLLRGIVSVELLLALAALLEVAGH